VDFSLQDLGAGSGWSSVNESNDGGSSGIVSSLESIGVNFAAGAAGVGLGALANNAGVSPYQANYNSALLTARPGSVSPFSVAAGNAFGNNSLLIVGGLLIGGLVLVALLRR
jgi:hypothetical protein